MTCPRVQLDLSPSASSPVPPNVLAYYTGLEDGAEYFNSACDTIYHDNATTLVSPAGMLHSDNQHVLIQ